MKLGKSNNSVSTFFYANAISARSHACHTRLQRHQTRTEMLNADNIQKNTFSPKSAENKQTNQQKKKNKAEMWDLRNVLEDSAFCILYLKSETRKKFCYLWIVLKFYLINRIFKTPPIRPFKRFCRTIEMYVSWERICYVTTLLLVFLPFRCQSL